MSDAPKTTDAEMAVAMFNLAMENGVRDAGTIGGLALENEKLRAALRAVIGQCKRDDCSQAILLTYCYMEAERGLDGRPPMLEEAARG